MNDHSGCRRGFYQSSKSPYSVIFLQRSEVVDSITVGYYAEEGGTTGEFDFKWIKSSFDNEVYLKLEVYNDAFHALFCMPDLLELMASIDGQAISPDGMAAKLLSLGIADMTQKENPKRTI